MYEYADVGDINLHVCECLYKSVKDSANNICSCGCAFEYASSGVNNICLYGWKTTHKIASIGTNTKNYVEE